MTGRSQTKSTKRGQSPSRRRLRLGEYPRVSRQGPREDARLQSPDFQRKLIRNVLGGEYELVEYPAEIDVSGSRPKREILDEIIEAIEAGKLDGIAVARLDRLARLRPKDRVELIGRVEDAGGIIRSASEQLDTSTPEGRFARDVFLGVARMQWEQKSADFALAKQNAIALGRAIKSRAPFGFRFTADHGLEVVEHEAAIVQEIFKRRTLGWSYGRLAELFAELSGQERQPMSIRRMLENRTYLGELHYGRDPETALVNYEPGFPAIVPVELFRTVQEVNAKRAPGRGVAVGRARSLLAGIAVCAGCGVGLARKAGYGERLVYKCNTAKPRRCPASCTIGADELDGFVVDSVITWLGPVADERQEVDIELPISGDRAALEATLERARAALIAHETDVELEDKLGPEAYAAGRQARLQRIERLTAELAALGEQTELEHVRTTLRRELRGADGVLPVDDRRELLRVVLQAVIVSQAPRRNAPAAERVELIFADMAPGAPD